MKFGKFARKAAPRGKSFRRNAKLVSIQCHSSNWRDRYYGTAMIAVGPWFVVKGALRVDATRSQLLPPSCFRHFTERGNGGIAVMVCESVQVAFALFAQKLNINAIDCFAVFGL